MDKSNFATTGKVALALCVAGALLGVLIALLGRLFGHNLVMHGYGVFVAFQLAALVLGIVARSTPFGKASAVTSGLLLVGSLVLIS